MTSAASVFRAFDQYPEEDTGSNQQCDNAIISNNNKTPATNGGTATRLDHIGNYQKLFTPKFQKSTKNNPLCGICLPEWLSILKQRWRDIEWTVYWPRLLFVTMLSILNSLLGLMDHFLYGRRIADTEIHPRPVFILGHPRTGTTLLQSLLALDTERFATCSTFCAGFPSSFLSIEAVGKIVFRGVIDDHRPMDNVPLGFDLPQEDELATNVMSAGNSPYMPLFFMQQEPEFRPYYAFDDNAIGDERLEPSVMASARKQWTDAFLTLMRKLTVREEKQRTATTAVSSQRRRLLLKSPVHTARIPLLLQLFPDAQFIYIHRHPYDVLRSAMHMADTTYWYTYLNTPTDEQIMEFILRQYEILFDRYEAGRKQILSTTQNQQVLVEVSFDELSQNPIQTVCRVYSELGWTMTPTMEASLQTELADIKAYQRNSHRELSPQLKRIVNERWGPSFDRFGYEMDQVKIEDEKKDPAQ
ncbi:sulfotransferase family protein [Nitzschia inconspicua]|uniref:Sulfotransferase family protein n=1 Tax=Nitzschia inconspicua TaxID=303405 RepID=A0A9K3PHS1_9STRA|nr:sulfotransferase family protein [Nitzschia inconspicua]